jgi:hypothetical protein
MPDASLKPREIRGLDQIDKTPAPNMISAKRNSDFASKFLLYGSSINLYIKEQKDICQDK